MLQQEVRATCSTWVKEQTRSHHRMAEAVMMPLIENAHTKAGYGALLHLQYGFYQPMEQLIFSQLGTLPLPEPQLHKSALLLKDLQVLGIQPGAICSDLPLVNDKFAALGALYVLEGASLGGRIIARMLQKHAALPLAAFSFFKGREEATGTYWTRFTQFLNDQADTHVHMQAVTDAASATFAAYTRWIQTF